MVKSKYALNEFADIYERSEDIINDINYYINRDNFFSFNRSWIKEKEISKEEVRNKFLRAPKIEDKRLYEFAAANAMYYLNIFGCDSVDWVEKALEDCNTVDSKPFYWFVKDIEEEKENTPEEFKKFGFIMHRKHMEIR